MTHHRSVNLFDLFIWVVVCISLLSVVFLMLNRFSPYSAVAAGIGLAGCSVWLFRLKISVDLRGIPLPLMIILLIALVFRAQPYLFVPGGQDQGVYVNMSAVYERDGSTFIIDEVREKAIQFGLKDWYDAANQRDKWPHVKPGKYEGGHLPGVYVKDFSRSEYVFQFYPLHPLWMAIVGKLVGEAKCVYSLVFFSLLSIIGVYLIALNIPGGSKTTAFLIGVFLALNPLHAFFSKFPVSEIVSLCFSSLGFYYLIQYYKKASAGEGNLFFLLLSAGLFGCMFFTRISGFMYLPLFYALLLVAVVFEKDSMLKTHLSLFFLCIFGVYALSLFYGIGYSYPYSYDVYNIFFGGFLGRSWLMKIKGIAVGAGIILCLVFLTRQRLHGLFARIRILEKTKNNINMLLCLALGVVMLMACYKAYQLGFTDQYAGGQYGIGGQGWASVRYANIYSIMIYLSPVGLGVLLYGMGGVFPRRKEVVWTGFLLFLVMFWSAFTLIMFLTRYHYYYARYFVSEVIPYSLLAIVIVLGYLLHKRLRVRIFSMCLIAGTVCFFLYFTCYQFIGRSADGAYVSLNEINRTLEKNDLLLLYNIKPPLLWVLKTPLSLFYGLKTCNLSKISDLQTLSGKKFINSFDNVFILSKDSLRLPFLMGLRQIKYKQGDFVKSVGLPSRAYEYQHEKLNLLKVNKSGLTSDVIFPMEMKHHLKNFYDGLWTNGNGIIRNLERRLKANDRYIRVNTRGLNPFIHNLEWPKPQLYLNGTKQEFSLKRGNSFTFIINSEVDVIREIRIASATFVPKKEGINKDGRRLGLDVDSIVLSEKNLDTHIYPIELAENLRNFYEGVWTNGDGIIQNVNYELRQTDKFISIHTRGWNPFMRDAKWPIPELYINGIRQTFESRGKYSYIYRIGGDIKVIQEIRIVSAVFVPQKMRINEDSRRLGVDVHCIVIDQRRHPGS